MGDRGEGSTKYQVLGVQQGMYRGGGKYKVPTARGTAWNVPEGEESTKYQLLGVQQGMYLRGRKV